MGFQGVVQASVLFLLIAECFAQTASRNRITVKSYKTNYRVDSWDDGRDEPYRVTFWKFGLKSVYLFDVEGHLRSLTTRDTTTFTFGEVVGFRMLNVPNDEAVEGVRSDLSSLIACTDCEVTWNTLCEVGLPEVCLWDENPRADFNGDAIDSVRRMCSAFGNACETSAADTCAGQCTADACNPNPCENGGSCSLDPAGGHICSCASGYGGMTCGTDTSSLDPFFIEINYVGTWSAARRAVFQSAADRWSQVITHVPCGGTVEFPAGRLLITATLVAIDGVGGTTGSAGPSSVWSGCRAITVEGTMRFDSADVANMEANGIFDGVILKEMGHVIGIGSLWGANFGECTTCRQTGDPAWTCPAAVSAYADIGGSDADIVEAIVVDGVSGRTCTNLDEDIFGDELMTGVIDDVMFLSKMTAAVLEDLEYIVDASAVDAYILPSERDGTISDSPAPLTFEDTAADAVVKVLDEDGGVVEEIDGIIVEF